MKLPVNLKLNMQTHIFIFLSHCTCMGVSKKRFVINLLYVYLDVMIMSNTWVVDSVQLTPVEYFEVELRFVRLYLTDCNCIFDIGFFCLFLIAPKMQPKFCAINTFFAIKVFFVTMLS